MESPHTSASFTLSSTQRIWEKNLLLLAGKGEKKPVWNMPEHSVCSEVCPLEKLQLELSWHGGREMLSSSHLCPFLWEKGKPNSSLPLTGEGDRWSCVTFTGQRRRPTERLGPDRTMAACFPAQPYPSPTVPSLTPALLTAGSQQLLLLWALCPAVRKISPEL